MKEWLSKAKHLLEREDYTCVMLKDDNTYTSKDRGVKPLLDWLDMGVDLSGAFVADKVVGKAAAFLYVLLGVKGIYAVVISEPAYKVLKDYNIGIMYHERVSAIKNRAGTGFCPMESSVLDVEEPDKAYRTILKTRDKLMNIAK